MILLLSGHNLGTRPLLVMLQFQLLQCLDTCTVLMLMIGCCMLLPLEHVQVGQLDQDGVDEDWISCGSFSSLERTALSLLPLGTLDNFLKEGLRNSLGN